MSRLSLSLLGAFHASLDGEPITSFESAMVRALLAYLAVESDRPHRRETLAALLWPEQPEGVARNRLRHTLSSLRKTIGDRDAVPPFLFVTRETVQFNSASDCWLDVHTFRKMIEADHVGSPASRRLEEAVALYRGSFLQGFSVKGSLAFEDWALLVRERLQRQAAATLQRLVEEYAGCGEHERACEYAWRWVELEPWQEEAHQQLMRVLALSDQRTTALAQYEVCWKTLQREFGVEPSDRTRRLYEHIRDGTLAPNSPLVRYPEITVQQPAFPGREEPAGAEQPVFVARESELRQLDGYLHQALDGQGRVIFVTGEAGQGKTALIQTFAQRAQDAYPDLIVVGGNCNAYTGLGDPYLPFREILAMLTADIDARIAAGAIGHEHARRLRRTLPLAAQALLRDGADLMGVFIPGAALLRRAIACVSQDRGWVDRLQELVELGATGAGARNLRQDDLFEQYTLVLQALARQVPLLLVVDDMQWADLGSISLLFHLGRRLAGSRILILGAYRPEEVALGRPLLGSGQWEQHPLEPLVHEFKRDWGEIEVALDRAEGRQFVEALLDSEPNQLGAGFRETLYRQTRGHPLSTIELLRGMQERGDLVQDSESRWVVGPTLDWGILPPRVEAVIAQRVERLAEPLRKALSVASVEGEVFTAEVVARAQAVDEQEMVASLSGELDRRHRLIRAQGVQRAADQRLSRYRFRHILFQQYLYNSLDEVERARLHEQVGTALETLYGGRTEEMAAIAPQLAWHFERAGMPAEAVAYYQQAGDRAVRMSANAEAIVHLSGGIELLKTLPDTPERAERELALRLAVAVPILAQKSWAVPEADRAYTRARELCEEIGDTSQLLLAMSGERALRTARAKHRAAVALAEECFDLAQRTQDPLQVMIGHYGLAITLLFVGEFSGSLAHVEQVVALYDLQLHRSLAFSLGQDPAVASLSFAVYDLWFLGYPDQALERGKEALALAKELDHPLTLLFPLVFVARLHRWRREVQAVQELAEAMLGLWTEHGMEMAEACGTMHSAWVLSERGQPAEGSAQFELGLAAWQATGLAMHLPEFLAVWAEMHGKAGDPEKGLKIVEEALALAHNSGERYYEAELYRLRGLLLLMPDVGDEHGAEASFYEALEAARRLNAKMCELRATVSLCQLWLTQERGDKYREAHEMLAGVYDWFTEGFDTRDLQEAKAVLDALA